jgi:hypothetical protein
MYGNELDEGTEMYYIGGLILIGDRVRRTTIKNTDIHIVDFIFDPKDGLWASTNARKFWE